MKKFEYKAVPIKSGTLMKSDKFLSQFEPTLNELGAEGWELVSSRGNAGLEGFVLLVFKHEQSQ